MLIANQGDSSPRSEEGSQPQAAPPPTGSVFSRINDFHKQYLGRDATPQEYGQWGSNVDDQYMGKIGNAIFNSDEAQKYRQSQAQQSQPGTTTTTTTNHPPAQTGSPVSADGKIPPPTQQVAAPTVQTYTAPTAFHSQPGQGRELQATQLNQTPIDTYTPGQMSQFNGPNQQGLNSQQNNLVNSILQNPETLNPNVLAQMKGAQKDEALAMQRQLQQGYDQNNAARGTLGGGFAQAQQGQLANNAVNSILTGNRNLDVQAAQTNRADQLNALNASEQIGQGQMGRSTQGYGAQLAGQQAQAGQNFQGFQSRVASQQDAVQRALAQFGINQGVAANRQQNYGQDLGAEMALEQLKQNSAGINNAGQFNLANFLEGQRQFNGNLGFNWAQLDQQGQGTLMDWLMRNGG